MSLDQLRLINVSLGAVLIALYVFLALSFVPDLLPDSGIAILLNGSEER